MLILPCRGEEHFRVDTVTCPCRVEQELWQRLLSGHINLTFSGLNLGSLRSLFAQSLAWPRPTRELFRSAMRPCIEIVQGGEGPLLRTPPNVSLTGGAVSTRLERTGMVA